MFTLIKREVIDNIIFFVAAVLFAAILVAIMFTISLGDEAKELRIYYSVAGSFPVSAAIFIGLSWMGATQMHMDRTKKIYAMLFTKPVSRSQVLFAKFITGLLVILVLLVPIFAAAAILLNAIGYQFPDFELLFPGVFIQTAVGVQMIFLGCYCLGLACGLSPNKIIPAFGGVILSALLVPIVFIKGFGFEALGIIIMFVVLCLLFVWKRFLSMSV